MAITSVSGWSATVAADNDDLNSIPLDANLMKGPHVNDAFQELMKQAKAGFATIDSASLTGLTTTITYTDAGAGGGPVLDLYRVSSSPAAADVIGAIQFNGRDSGSAKQLYAQINAIINDPTAASEDGKLIFYTTVAGTATEGLNIVGTAVSVAGTLELGDASDTTLSRLGAGRLGVEGVEVATASNTLTLTNKTFSNTGLNILDTNASHTLGIVPGSNITANRTLTLTTGDADRTITLSGNPTLADWFDQSVKQAATPTFGGLTISNTSSVLILNETDGSADNKRWDMIANGEALVFRVVNDAVSVVTSWLTVNRTGTTIDDITLGGTSFRPSANDASSLGVSGTAWSDLFLASGGVINFAAGNAAITHSSGTLTITGQLMADNPVFGESITLSVTDDSASAGPTMNLQRNSASPAANDVLGQLRFRFQDSGGTVTEGPVLRGLLVDPADGSESSRLQFVNTIAGVSATRFNMSDGFWAQGATGGDKGANTINAVAVYDDNVLLTDLVLDMAVTGDFDREAYAAHPVAGELEPWWLDPSAYAAYWREHRHLPGMISWLDEEHRPSIGAQLTRLTATAEVLAAHIATMDDRMRAAGL